MCSKACVFFTALADVCLVYRGQHPPDLHLEDRVWLVCPFLQVGQQEWWALIGQQLSLHEDTEDEVGCCLRLKWPLALLDWNSLICFVNESLELPPAQDINYLRWALEPPEACWAQGLSCSLLNVGSVYKAKPPQNPMPKMLRQIACPNLPEGSMRFSAHEDQGGLAVPEESGGVVVLGFPATLGHLFKWLFYTHQWWATEEMLSGNTTRQVKLQEPLNITAAALKAFKGILKAFGGVQCSHHWCSHIIRTSFYSYCFWK